jgi:hypothetical protein
MDSAEMLRSNQPIVQLRSKLSEEFFGSNSCNSAESSSSAANAQQWYSYYRSSIGDKMSDYEDIWDKSNSATAEQPRSITPAESELQFKAYLANKFQHDDQLLASNSECSTPSSDTVPRSSLSSLISSRDSSTEDLSIAEPSLLSSSCSSALSVIEEIYSDPLDALEQATDTRIYNCPEFGEGDHQEVIYEEAMSKNLKLKIDNNIANPNQSPKRRKRATSSGMNAFLQVQ